MSKNKNLLNVGVLCLAIAFGWYSQVVFNRLNGSGSEPPAQNDKNPAKAMSVQSHSAQEAGGFLGPGASGALPAGRLQMDGSGTVEAEGAALMQEPFQLQPEATPPPGMRPEDVDSSPEAGVIAPKRAIRSLQPQPVVPLPPGVRPEDVEISVEAGLIVPRRVSEIEPTQPPAVVTPPNAREGIFTPGPDTARSQKLPPDRKEPAVPQSTPPPKK